VELAEAIWDLSGGAAEARNGWPDQELSEVGGDKVWFKPGLDLRGVHIRCLDWYPSFPPRSKVREKEIERGLSSGMPGRLAGEPDGGMPGPVLSEHQGSLFLRGLCVEAGHGIPPGTCRVKLWDSATGEAVGLMQVSKGFWRTDARKDWARRILRQLRAQHPGENL
jgi:hypothetical protein